jgi:hypothetical protein
VSGKNKSGFDFTVHPKLTKKDMENKRDERLRGQLGATGSLSEAIGLDISTEQNKNISFYTSVILYSLYSSRKDKENGFRLFDGELVICFCHTFPSNPNMYLYTVDISNNVFKNCNTIPAEMKRTVATFVDCRNLVKTA